MSVRETIRRVLRDEKRSVLATASSLGLTTQSLQQFFAGKRGIEFASVEKLVDDLGLELVREVNFPEYCKERWPAVRDDEMDAYYEGRGETWGEEKKIAWEEYVSEQEDVPEDEDEYREWEAEVYPEWSTNRDIDEYPDWIAEYDKMYFAEAESEARDIWEEAERAKLESFEWVRFVGK